MRWSAVWILAGCPSVFSVERGSADACLLAEGVEEPELAETSLFDVAGTFAGAADAAPDGAVVLHPCTGEGPYRFLGVDDGAGATYWVGYTLADADDVPIEVEPAIADGAAVALRFRSIQSFGTASGFVLSADGAPAAIVENGIWGPALLPGDVEGLEVSAGAVVARDANGCGPIEGTEIVFTADGGASMVPVDSGAIAVGDTNLTAYALASWDFAGQPRCTDVAGALVWAAFAE